jgi:hypothetical protein
MSAVADRQAGVCKQFGVVEEAMHGVVLPWQLGALALRQA